jgi:hypothetical protein
LQVAKRLVIIFVTFLFLWLPYPFAVLSLRLLYVQHAVSALHRAGSAPVGAEPLTQEAGQNGLWAWPDDGFVRQTVTDVIAVLSALTTVTSAVNPVFYGIANVTIRSVIVARLRAVYMLCRHRDVM